MIKVVAAYGKAISKLRSADSSQRNEHEASLMKLLEGVVDFMMECGASEKCFYLVSLMVDVNVRTNSKARVDFEHVRRFCETNRPFIGEVNAKGWSSCCEA